LVLLRTALSSDCTTTGGQIKSDRTELRMARFHWSDNKSNGEIEYSLPLRFGSRKSRLDWTVTLSALLSFKSKQCGLHY
jgi:hypothetical protein